MTELSKRQLMKLLKKLPLNEGDVVLVKSSQFNETDILEVMRRGVEALGLKRVFVVIVENFDDIKTLDQKQMNAYGWYNIDQISKAVRKI